MKTFICPQSATPAPQAPVQEHPKPSVTRILLGLLSFLGLASWVTVEYIKLPGVMDKIALFLLVTAATSYQFLGQWLAERFNWRRFNNIRR